jgi:predicted nucleic acid-binding Zn ribbon protein
MSENYCYECGNSIPKWKHFCDRECSEKFKKRYPNIECKLGVITKFRKKKGLAYFCDEDKKKKKL